MKHSRQKSNGKKLKNALNLAALLAVALMMITVSYSWIESSSSLIVKGNSLNTETLPNEYINIGDGSTYANTVDLTSYFDRTSNFMFAPASSVNGSSFYFAASGSNYRSGTSSDINVNYISMEFYVTAKTAQTDFWFDEVPQFTVTDKNGTAAANAGKAFRTAINVNGTTKIYSADGVSTAAVNSTGGATAAQTCNKYSDYTYSKANAANTVFTLNKDQTQKVTVTIWLEQKDSSYSTADTAGSTVQMNLKLASSWSKKDTVVFTDMTNNASAMNWTNSDSATMWVTNKDTGSSSQMTYNSSNHTWSGNASVGAKNLVFYRCGSAGYNNGSYTYNNVKCNDYWAAPQRTNSSTDTYTAYGNVVSSSNPQGYGLWGASDSVVRITINDNYTNLFGTDTVTLTNKTTGYNGEAYAMYSASAHTKQAYVPAVTSNVNFSSTEFNGGDSDIRGSSVTYTTTGAATGTWGTPTTTVITFTDSSENHDVANSGTMKLVNSDNTKMYVNMVYNSTDHTYTATVVDTVTSINFVYTKTDSTQITWNAGSRGTETIYYVISDKRGKWGEVPLAETFYLMGINNDWTTGIQMDVISDSFAATTVTASSTASFPFKIKDVSYNVWYGNATTVTDTVYNLQLTTTDGSENNITLATGYKCAAQYRIIFNTVNYKVTVLRVPAPVESGRVRMYFGLISTWGSDWLQSINHWNVPSGKAPMVDVTSSKVYTNYSYSGSSYNMYYADLYTVASRFQFTNGSSYFLSSGKEFTPTTGDVYMLSSNDNVFKGSTSTGNIQASQTAPTSVLANNSSSITVSAGAAVSLTATGQNRGTLYGAGLSVSNLNFYLEDGTWISKSWTPEQTGTYKIYAKADDGYILSSQSTAYATVTVT